MRLSRLTDESTSPTRQRDRVTWWAGGNDAKVVHISEDLDVSGSKDPFLRDGLGPWLTDERASEWDILVAWKLDRISRSAEDTFKLLKWCEARGKRIVCVDDGIDSSTQMGRVWIQLAGIFAEVERNNIKERAIASRAQLRITGRWHGEAVPYGYIPEELPEGGWKLVVEPEAAFHVRSIVDDVLSGEKSIQSIADRLTSEGVLSPRDHFRKLRGIDVRGGKWNPQTIFRLLYSKSLLGEVSHKGKAVTDAEEMPIKKADPLITSEEWHRIQGEIEKRRKVKTHNRTNKASQLLGVATCFECNKNLHHRTNRANGLEYRYYYCPDNHGRAIRADKLEPLVEKTFLDELGKVEVVKRIYLPAEDHTVELMDLSATLDNLTADMVAAKSQTARNRISDRIASLDRRIAELEVIPPREAGWRTESTGVTYGEQWKDKNPEERRRLLIDSQIQFKAQQGDKLFVASHVTGDLLEQAFSGYEYPTLPGFSVKQDGTVGEVFNMTTEDTAVLLLGAEVSAEPPKSRARKPRKAAPKT